MCLFPEKKLSLHKRIETMTYLNLFHRQSVERCLKKVAQSKSLQLNCEEESKKAQEMHKRISKLYPVLTQR